MSKLARGIAQMEGFGIPGAKPTRDNNPGDLRHSPHSSHDGEGPDDIGVIDTVVDGWDDLEHQLQLDAQRGYTLEQLIYTYAPQNENDSAGYLKFICDYMQMSPTTQVWEALKVP